MRRWMASAEAQAREQDAADAKAAHESGEQKAERDGGGTDGELQKLVPDDFVDQRGAAAAGEKNHSRGKKREALKVTGVACE